MTVLDGARVQQIRKRLGLKQHHIATRAGIDVSTVSRIERGLITPSVATVNALAHALGVSVQSLLVEEDEEEPRKKRGSRKAA